jgi:hypothetical protein
VAEGKPLRVAVWSTGAIGAIAINALRERPQAFEIVGVWVHSPDKAGRDAGELAGGAPLGLAATTDAAALIALKPDCIVYAASGPERDKAAVRDYLRFLEAGINVVTSTSTHLISPDSYEEPYRSQLIAAAGKGRATIYAGGVEPGFGADYLPVVLTTQSKAIRKIHCYEIGLYDDYNVPPVMFDGMGFGRPLDFPAHLAMPGAVEAGLRGQIHLIAGALGVEVQEIRTSFERVAAPDTLEVSFGTIEAGTCGALRMTAAGVVDGKEAIVIDHVTRMAHGIAPEWPEAPGDLSYRVVIEGEPNIDTMMTLSLNDPGAVGIGWMGSGAGAMVSTAMRNVNAIPHVVAAPPGLASALTLPVIAPQGVFRP